MIFSASPQLGHLLPMVPLAVSAHRAGHDVVVFSSASLAAAVEPVPFVEVGPEFADLVAENARRHPDGWGADNGGRVGPLEAAQLYAGTRLDTTLDQARRAAREFGPDIVVAEWVDYVGPMLAAELGVPWAVHGLGPALPDGFSEMLEAPLPDAYRARGLVSTERVAYLDPCPEFLQAPGWTASADRIALRPRPHAGSGAEWTSFSFPGRIDRPRVLLTLGTMVEDPDVYYAWLAAIESIDVNVIVTWAPCGDPGRAEVDRARVHPVGFVALEQLLRHVDVVIAPGGAGTVLGSLSAGRPLVLHPMLADHPGNARRAASTGGAVVVEALGDLGAALDTVLTDQAYADAAAEVARHIATLPSHEQAVQQLDTLVQD